MMVRTRVAPSPTGDPHIGTLYTALIDYAVAKKGKGQFLVRIEDTDRTRFVEGAEQKIYDALDWIGIFEDESPRKGGPLGPYRQSERLKLYQKYAHGLVEKGAAYYCFCSTERLAKLRRNQQKKKLPPKYDRFCLSLDPAEVKKRRDSDYPYVIRLKIPDSGITTFYDLLRGKVQFENKLLDDQVLLKSDGYPTYHLAVVVDDHLMQISHIIRAEEWISSTPKHILLYRALGWKPPLFAHHSLLRNPDHSKLSKRRNPTSVLWYREQGFLPEATRNYLNNLGWTHPEGKEVYPLEKFVQKFELTDLIKTAPVFDLEKLNWMNGVYIRQKSLPELTSIIADWLKKYSDLEPGSLRSEAAGFLNAETAKQKKVVSLVQDRIKTLQEFKDLTNFFWAKAVQPDLKDLIPKKRSTDGTKKLLELIRLELKTISQANWQATQLEKTIRSLQAEGGWSTRELFMCVRVAITGESVTPPLFESMEILGKQTVLQRLNQATKLL